MNRERLETMAAVALIGSLWGLTEATVGYLIHVSAVGIPGLPGFVMFPIACLFIFYAYRLTGSRAWVMAAAAVAASVKLFDLFLPLPHPIFAVNPALAIMLEAGAVAVFLPYFRTAKAPARLGLAVAAAFAYHAMFIILQAGFLWTGILPASLNFAAKMWTVGVPMMVSYFITETAVNAGLIFLALSLGLKRTEPDRLIRRLSLSPALPAVFAAAAGLEMLFKYAR